MKNQAKTWLELAKNDLEVAKEIIDRVDLTHMVAFHCQQAIEKSFKAVLEENEDSIPRVHDLTTLRGWIEVYLEIDLDTDVLGQLNELYVDARYPSEMNLVPGRKPPLESSRRMYDMARSIWEQVQRSERE